jgi:hypothetical protein
METPDDWELIAFFEQDPIEADLEEAEFFGSLSFERDLGGGDILQWSVSRSFGDLQVTLTRNGLEQIVLKADDVASVKIERLHGVETLVALFGDGADLREARLTLRPALRLEWGSKFQG